uniref:Uncharacterized protein n=1 Tax=Mycena chlorophos TaxID=658473 RepID=A0ABQ0LV30_MYCCL|nr:predicted protein [Mycena chlorophos]
MSASAYSPLATSSTSDDAIDLLEMLRTAEGSRARRHRHVAPKSTSAILFCGADQSSPDNAACAWDEQRPWRLQVVPDADTPMPPRKRQRRSNGCAAQLHASADSGKRWTGMPDGVGGVTTLDERYFSHEAKRELMLGKERCGCSRTGMGCTICGNPVGALFEPCQRHAFLSHLPNLSNSHYVFLPSAVSPPLPTPIPRRTMSSSSDGIQFDFSPRASGSDLRSLFSRIRAGGMQPEDQPASDTRTRATLPPLFPRNSPPPPPPVPTPPSAPTPAPVEEDVTAERVFEVWAEETISRATALAATTIDTPPLIDLTTPPLSAATVPRPDSPESAWANFERDWPPITRSYERSSATQGDEDSLGSTPEGTVTMREEQEKQDVVSRTLFER